MTSSSEPLERGRGRDLRVLFTASPRFAPGFPAASLGSAFRTAGHEVLVAGEPSLMSAVAGTGLAATALGRDRRAHDHVDESLVDDLVQLTRRWRPDLIVHDAASCAGAVAGAVLGVPTVGYLDTDPPWSRCVRLCARFGLKPGIEPTAWVDPFPPSMALPARSLRLPVRFVPSHGPVAVPAWLLAPPTRARICVPWWITQAATADADEQETLRQVMAGLTTLDAEIVLVIDEVDRALDMLTPLIEESLATVRVLDSVALPTLLRAGDVVVHQGGVDTTLTAAACGTPQLIIVRGAERTLSGDRLSAVGAGRCLLADELSPAAVGADIVGTEAARMLDRPVYGTAAQRLRVEIEQQPTPAELVCSLIRLITDLQEQGQDRVAV